MKKHIAWLVCGMTAVLHSACAAPTARVMVKVVEEDTGNPISGLFVHSSTLSSHIPRADFGSDVHSIEKIKTTKDGLAIFEIPCPTGIIVFGAHNDSGTSKDSLHDIGYYNADRSVYKATGSDHGCWQPWNPNLTIKLKKIVKPIPMYAKKVDTKIPKLDTPCGYDLMKGDWVAPYGKGEKADFVFRIDVKKLEDRNASGDDYFEASFSLTFSCAGDGLLSVKIPTKGRSELRMPYSAPDTGYNFTPEIQKKYNRIDGSRFYGDRVEEMRNSQNYFFRVRSEKNNNHLFNAYYGKMHGQIEWWSTGTIRFNYYFNPTPNDRNMEFDPQKNLFGKPSLRSGPDKSSVGVYDP